MTSSTATKSRQRRGFTLIELMVTMGIILLLIGILLPVLIKARKTALRARMAMDLHGIALGLEAYHQDFHDYPRIDYNALNPITVTDTTNNPTPPPTDRLGAVTLCWALVAPGAATVTTGDGIGGDGYDGPGFRVRGTQGQVYQPYIQVDKYNITGTNNRNSTINDAHGNPYLYFPAFTGADINHAAASATTNGGGYVNAFLPTGSTFTPPAGVTPVSVRPMYNFLDNPIVLKSDTSTATFTLEQMRVALGDTGTTLPAAAGGPNGVIDGTESPATTAAYILWGAGPDDAFGPPLQSNNTYGTSDDVTNFN